LLFGHGGDDTLLGGEGDDQLSGGQGADQLIGGNGVDWAVYESNLLDAQPSSSVIISLINPASNTWWAAGDTYDSIENIYGSIFNDVITGNDNDNIIVDSDGSNTFYGNGGNDTFVGCSEQADTFYGGSGSDTVDYSGAEFGRVDVPPVSTSVTIDLQNQGVNAGAAAGDRFDYVENIIGTSRSDTILGDNRSNDLRGGDGADRLMGRGGTDTLRGDEGIDTAVFRGNVDDYSFRVLQMSPSINNERYLEVTDLTANRDGTDYVMGIEQLEFNGVVHNISEWLI
jgi:Ca2+-binding RTX toxin-like protein